MWMSALMLQILPHIEEELKNPNYKFYKTDIRDREAIEKIFEEEKPDVVVNFAAESHVDRSITNPQIFLETNILGTAVLMDACRKYGIERYHQVSTDRYTQAVHTQLQTHLQTCWFSHTIEHMACLLQSADVLTTMVLTSSLRS